MYKKLLFLTSFVLVLSLAYNSYGDTAAPKPNPMSWRDVPAALGPNTITMTATTAIDANDPPPVQYYFECTNHGEANSTWQTSPIYTPNNLTPSTVYSFRVKARDSVGNETAWTSDLIGGSLSATTDANTTPPAIRLDFNYDPNNNEPNTQTGFMGFIRGMTGSEVNDPNGDKSGITIDLGGNLSSARRVNPSGSWEKYDPCGSVAGDPCWYSPQAGERLYRDFIFGAPPSGVTITLWELGTNRDCNITIWAFDVCSTGDANRIANWYANGKHIFDTEFRGSAAFWAGYYDNQPGGAKNLYKYAFKGRVTTDANLGNIVLTSIRGPNNPTGEPFAFVDALKVEPNSSQAYVATKYAHRPVPFDGAEDVPVTTLLKWRNGAGVVTHDIYFGTDEDAVTNANRTSTGLMIYAPDRPVGNNDNLGYNPGLLDLATTYYWRVDENDNPPVYKEVDNKVWSFTTGPNSVVDSFNAYQDNPTLYGVWKDWHSLIPPPNGTCATVLLDTTTTRPGLKWDSTTLGQSMSYLYQNYNDPYYSEATATIGTGVGQLNINPDWLGANAKSLVLYFYGTVTNDANQQMYVKLSDGTNSATVNYPPSKMNDIREKAWHEWNIDLAKFTGVNLASVSTITIGFGNGTPADEDGTIADDIVYFDDIQVYTTRCALVERDPNFVRLDFAPSGAPAGDCVIDYQEIELMANTWLNRDVILDTNRPGDSNLVIWYPMNEADGNKIYNHTDTNNPDVCEPRVNGNGLWEGTFWNNGASTPGYFGTRWDTPGAPGIGGNSCVYMSGVQGSRIQCGDPCRWGHLALGIGSGKPTADHYYPNDNNAITLSIWVKWLGPRTWDGYLLTKCQGLIGKRGGWDDTHMVWMLELDTNGSQRGFGLRHYAVGDTTTPDVYTANNLMMPYIGQWVHIAASYPHPAADPCADANSQARLYLNGGQVASGPWRFSLGDDPNIYLSIGETQDQNAWPEGPESFYGYLDEVRIYNRVLGPNEIAYLASIDPCNPQLWVPIPSGAEIRDSNDPTGVRWIDDFNEPKGQRAVNFKDFALVADPNRWLKEEMFPR